MRKLFNRVHNKYPFLNSVFSVIFGAVLSYLFSNIIDTWRQNGTLRQKVLACFLFAAFVSVVAVYYKIYYTDQRATTVLEKEREKSEIQRIKNEREMVTSLFKEGTKEIQNENLTIKEKTEIFKQISLVTNDNKRRL